MKTKYFRTITLTFFFLSLLLFLNTPYTGSQQTFNLPQNTLPYSFSSFQASGLPSYFNTGFSSFGFGLTTFPYAGNVLSAVQMPFSQAMPFSQSFGGLGLTGIMGPVPTFNYASLPYGLGFPFVTPVKKPSPKPSDIDHIGQFNFKVEIEGVTVGAFKNVEGLDSETEVIEYQDGDDLVLRKRPGRVKNSNITLKEGVDLETPPAEMADRNLNDFFSQWRQDILEGTVEAKKGAVLLYNQAGEEIMRYNIFGAWPSKWKGYSLDGKGNDVLVEEVTLVVQEIDPEIKKYSTYDLPFSDRNYELFVGDERLAVFEDASIITEPETEIIEYKEGDPTEGIPTYSSLAGMHKVLGKHPGRTKYSNMILKRGYLDSGVLWDWYESIAEGAVSGIHKIGSVVVSKPGSAEPLGRYNFFEAWPSKWKGFTLDGKGSDVNVEEIELAIEKVERD
ncbi:MAG: phage tail protein [bacterium]